MGRPRQLQGLRLRAERTERPEADHCAEIPRDEERHYHADHGDVPLWVRAAEPEGAADPDRSPTVRHPVEIALRNDLRAHSLSKSSRTRSHARAASRSCKVPSEASRTIESARTAGSG